MIDLSMEVSSRCESELLMETSVAETTPVSSITAKLALDTLSTSQEDMILQHTSKKKTANSSS